MICNYINTLPRCQQQDFNQADTQPEQGLIARQTQQRLSLEVEVGELGYLSSEYTGAATVTTVTTSLLVVSVLHSILNL